MLPITQHAVLHRSRTMMAMAVIVATLVLGGAWHLYQWHGGMPSVRFAVGAGCLLAGAALWLQRYRSGPDSRGQALGRTYQLLAAGVFVSGLFGILHPAFTGIEFLAAFSSYFGGIPLTISLVLMLAGWGLLLIDHASRHGHYPAEYFAVAIAFLMSIPLIGYLYRWPGQAADMPSHEYPMTAAILFIILAAGMLMARPQHGLMKLWRSNAPGARLRRRLLLQSAAVLMLCGLIAGWSARQGILRPENAAPLVMVFTFFWLAWMLQRAASMLDDEYDSRRNKETALRETGSLLHAVSENVPDAIFVKDTEGKIVFANPAMFRMLGKDAEQVIGRSTREIYEAQEDAAVMLENDQHVMARGIAAATEETVHTPEGTRTFYSTRAPWKNSNGKLLGVVGISTDITERKRMEEALRVHETQLETMVAERTAEVRDLVAHLESMREEEKRALARELHDDLGSALTALSMHLAILFQQMPDDQRLKDRSVQIKTLINSVVQATRRIQAGLRPDKLDVFGIKAAIEDLATEFQHYSGIACMPSMPDEDISYPPKIEIALYRIAQEALNNIAKHARASHVDLVLDDTDDSIVLSIRDNGIGFRTDEVSPASHGLRGIRERASYLGGEVIINSVSGQGTNLVITLPKSQASHMGRRNGFQSGSLQRA